MRVKFPIQSADRIKNISSRDLKSESFAGLKKLGIKPKIAGSNTGGEYSFKSMPL